jgi:hypothetical protein
MDKGTHPPRILVKKQQFWNDRLRKLVIVTIWSFHSLRAVLWVTFSGMYGISKMLETHVHSLANVHRRNQIKETWAQNVLCGKHAKHEESVRLCLLILIWRTPKTCGLLGWYRVGVPPSKGQHNIINSSPGPGSLVGFIIHAETWNVWPHSHKQTKVKL